MKKWIFGILGCFVVVFSFGSVLKAEEQKVEQEKISAIKLQESAVIDGILDDKVWEKAFHDKRVYIDDQLLSSEPFQDEPTETWVYYNDEALFLAFKCYDKEIIYQYTQKKSTPDLARGTDDTVGFALLVDTNKHYDLETQYWYILNPVGAFWFRPAVGRATKEEFAGKCYGQAKIYEGYWTAEIKLYWTAVDYPMSDEPYDILLKPDRRHKKLGMPARLAHYPKTFAGPDTRLNFCRFVGFQPPQKGIETRIAPTLFAGWNQVEKKWERHFGLDFRLRPTSQTNFFLTVNPDFSNIEQYVGRIDPIYGPRMLQDYRYFFQEGRQILKLSPYNFYSRYIGDIDAGLSAYGKIYGLSLVALSTFYRGGDHNLVLRGYGNPTEKDHLGAVYIRHRETENSVFWTDYSRTGSFYEVKADFAQSWVSSDARGRKYWSQYSLFKKECLLKTDLRGDLQLYAFGEDYQDDLGFHPFKGIRGGNLTVKNEKVWQEGKRYYQLWSMFELLNRYDGSIFRRTADVYLWHRRGNHGYYANIEGGRYEENKDVLFRLMHWRNYGNQERFFKITYTGGRRTGKGLNQLDPSFAYRFKKLRANITTQFLWYEELQKQLIVNLNYELTKTFGLGSRLVWNEQGKNIYFALHRSGFWGAEFFVIVGNPNAQEFQRRIIGKVVMAF